MDSNRFRRVLLSLSSLSLLALAGCSSDQEATESQEPATVEQAESGTSYSEELNQLAERLNALYEEGSDSQDVNIDSFYSDEALEDDLKGMQDQVELEEEIQQLDNLLKEYGLVQTMVSVKEDLAERYDAETGEILSEEDLPLDFEMRLQSLEVEKPGFYETYFAHYDNFQQLIGEEVEEDEAGVTAAEQARINAIRSLVLNADGTINSNVSTADLQALYNELVNLGGVETAAAINSELQRRANETEAEEESSEERESSSQPESSQPPQTQPPQIQPDRTQPPQTQPPRTNPPSTSAPDPTPEPSEDQEASRLLPGQTDPDA